MIYIIRSVNLISFVNLFLFILIHFYKISIIVLLRSICYNILLRFDGNNMKNR